MSPQSLRGQCGVSVLIRADALGWARPLPVPPQGRDDGEVASFLYVVRLRRKGEVVANLGLSIYPGLLVLAGPRSFGLSLADVSWAA